MASQRLSAGFAAGELLRLFGFIRTEDLASGQARLWLRVDRGDERMALVNMDRRGPSAGAIVARLFGKNDVTMVVRDQYDGVVLIDTTWPPEYLDD